MNIQGKYNNAIIYNDNVEQEALSQIYNLLDCEAFKDTSIRIMPDVHAGAGCVIGFTSTFSGKICPNLLGVDLGCFTGDTIIPLLDGTKNTLKELSNLQESFYVYSINKELKVIAGKAKALKTRENAELLEICISGGSLIRCTSDHKFMMIDGSYKEAQYLKPFDSLMPLYRSYQTRDGYEYIKSKGVGCLTHKMIAKEILKDFSDEKIVHHKNGKWWDNDPDNLSFIKTSDHSSLHRKMKPIFTNEEFKRKRKEILEEKGYYRPELQEKKERIMRENGRKYMTEHREEWLESIKDNGKRGSKYLIECNNMVLNCQYCNRQIKGKGSLAGHEKSCCKKIQINHKVLWVKKLNYREDVYCLNVEKYHNFALDAGVFVHNCGILAVDLGDIDIDFQKLDDFIRKEVPSGFNVNSVQYKIKDNFSKRIKEICKKTKQDENRVLLALGSLGGGNHFLEVGENKEGNKILLIHTGSRNFGLKIANHYQKLAEEYIRETKNEDNYIRIKSLDPSEREKMRLEMKDNKIPKGLEYLEGDLLNDYLRDMEIAQEYAHENRQIIKKKILRFLGVVITNEIESVHNYFDFNDRILRKGAISAHRGKSVIIPWNMRDGSIIGIGKGNKEWNYSAPHGAGRLMSRSKAKENVLLEDFQDSMKGIWSTSISKDTIDESPMVYKNYEEILEYIKDTVEIIDTIKPLYNFKAS